MISRKFLPHSLAITTITLGTVTLASQVQAATFVYEKHDPNAGGLFNSPENKVEYVYGSYNERKEQLTWSATFSSENDMLPDGGWLVVSPGPNPKGHDEELAIFYLDGITNKLTAYAYDGRSPKSWQTEDLLDSWDNAVKVEEDGNKRTLSFNVNVAQVNAYSDDPEWTGAAFGEKIGIWFHPAHGLQTEYDEYDALEQFSFEKQGWIDRHNKDTKSVPEPSSLAAFGIGALGLLASKKRR